MNGLSLSNTFRFATTGIVVLMYFYIADKTLLKQLLDALGPVGITFVTFATGGLIYWLYRSLVYDPIVLRIQDRCRKKSDNYRTYLMKRYSVSHNKANFLFNQIRNKFLQDRYSEGLSITASGIHFLYQVGITAFPFIIWKLVVGNYKISLLFLIIAILSLIGAFIYDRRYEETELGYILILEDEDLDKFVERLKERLMI